ncbi:hypothetical protein [Candidatus Sororendozoicomonas aggregata]|uniref:hypothetical protein n=1 Tax=Candidatus Sororendozoicomonas aggregata TaxID=3073239 RepID=UPI002ECFD280
MWREEDLQIIPIRILNNIKNTGKMEAFKRVEGSTTEYIQGFWLRGDTRPFNEVFTEGFYPHGQLEMRESQSRAERAASLYSLLGPPSTPPPPICFITTALYSVAFDQCGKKESVYMIDAQKRFGFPLLIEESSRGCSFAQINFLHGFPGTDVVGFIRRPKEPRGFELLCNPDYEGDFTYVDHVINTPRPVISGRDPEPVH